MSRSDGPVSDALVDAYRDIMTLKRNLATTGAAIASPIVPGAGVSPTKRIVPSKRLRSWHRANRHGLSLRAFVRAIADRQLDGFRGDSAVETAKHWLASKGARP